MKLPTWWPFGRRGCCTNPAVVPSQIADGLYVFRCCSCGEIHKDRETGGYVVRRVA